MLTSHKKLADFETGWKRHANDDGIVFTSNLEIFHAAAKKASENCRAVILNIPEEEKAKDRSAFQQAWNTSLHDKQYDIALKHTSKTGLGFAEHTMSNGQAHMIGYDISLIEAPINQMIAHYTENE